jgi:hypothetical protein
METCLACGFSSADASQFTGFNGQAVCIGCHLTLSEEDITYYKGYGSIKTIFEEEQETAE